MQNQNTEGFKINFSEAPTIEAFQVSPNKIVRFSEKGQRVFVKDKMRKIFSFNPFMYEDHKKEKILPKNEDIISTSYSHMKLTNEILKNQYNDNTSSYIGRSCFRFKQNYIFSTDGHSLFVFDFGLKEQFPILHCGHNISAIYFKAPGVIILGQENGMVVIANYLPNSINFILGS